MSSPRVATANKFIEAFSKLDKEALFALASPSFTYTFAPSSAGLPPPMSRDAWFTHITNVVALLKTYPVTVQFIIDCGDPENKVVVHATGQAQFKDEVKDEGIPNEEWVSNGEYIIVFTMNADAKLNAVFEFMDSKSVDRLSVLVQRASENLKKRLECSSG
jgi:hypothetical protein